MKQSTWTFLGSIFLTIAVAALVAVDSWVIFKTVNEYHSDLFKRHAKRPSVHKSTKTPRFHIVFTKTSARASIHTAPEDEIPSVRTPFLVMQRSADEQEMDILNQLTAIIDQKRAEQLEQQRAVAALTVVGHSPRFIFRSVALPN